MSLTFVWGAGGVGKTHISLRRAALAKSPTLLMTLDPSFRVYDLLEVPRTKLEAEIRMGQFEFTLKRTDQNSLFEKLSAKKVANPKVRIFYDQMVKGLQDFRDYLTLIQLSDELSESSFSSIIIDTPPLQEAVGLHRSLFNLRHFFEQSLVQLALKSNSISWVHAGFKKIFEVARIFSGKRAADQIFSFVEWLTQHTERLSHSARILEDLVYSKDTQHLFVITPETHSRFFDSIDSFFEKSARIDFVLNRSVQHWELPFGADPVTKEFKSLQNLQADLEAKIESRYPKSKIERIPLMLMGEDSREELLRFLDAR